MKLIRILLFLLVVIPLNAIWVDQDGAGIGEIDISNDPNYTSYIPSIAVDSRGYPHIAWYSNDLSGNLEIYYLYWDGLTWVDADGSGQESKNVSLNSTNSEYPMLVLDSLDRPHIAWEDGTSGDREVYYLQWNGSSWVDADEVGMESINMSNMAGYSGHPAIALNSSNRASIVWSQQDGTDETKADVYFARWNMVKWVGAVTNFPEKIYESAYYSMSPFICLNAAGAPFVTWSDGPDLGREIYFLKYNGTAWTDADGAGTGQMNISNTLEYSAWPKMDMDTSGRPHIVWEDASEGGQNIYYLRWNGSAWADVDGSGMEKINVSATYHFAFVPQIKLDYADTPHIMWGEGSVETCDIMSVKWNGSAWSDETGGGISYKRVYHDAVNSEWPSFDLDSSGNPHIAWSNGETFMEHDIYYLRWLDDGTPTITPTYKESDTPYPTRTPTKTATDTFTITATHTLTPIPPAVINPDPCWADADGTGAEDDPVSSGTKPVLRLDSSGRPHMTWVNNGKVYYMKYNGSRWVDADGSGSESLKISGTVFGSDAPDMVLDSGGMPHIAWTGFQTGYTFIYYLRWDGTKWVDVNGVDTMQISVPIIQGGYASDVTLALDNLQRPNLAWSDYPENLTYTVTDIFYYRWNGFDWVDSTGSGRDFGRVTDNTLNCTKPAIKMDNWGDAHIAYRYGSSKIRYLKWNTGAWVDAGGMGVTHIDAITTGTVLSAFAPELHLDALYFPSLSFPCIIGAQSYPCFLKWNGTQWVDADGSGQGEISLPSFSNVESLSMEYDTYGNPSIAWYAQDGIYFMKWDGSAWVDADGISTESALILSLTKNGNAISLDLDAANNPALVWDNSSQDYFLKYICGSPTNTHTISPTRTVSPTITQTPTISATHTISPTQTPTPSPTPAPVLISIHKTAAGNIGVTEVIYTIRIQNDPDKYVYDIRLWDTLPDQLEYAGMITGLEPQPVTGQCIVWDWGGGVVLPDEELVVSFRAKIRNPQPDMLVANTAAADYNDDYYNAVRHPVVYSNQAFYPEGRAAVYPNPFNPHTASGGKMKFVNMRPDTTVSIYTLSGDAVRSISSGTGTAAYWDAKNSFGNYVSPGIYFFVVRNAGNAGYSMKGKIYVVGR